MKDLIIFKCMNIIKKNKKYSNEDLIKIKYGLEGVYLTVSKLLFVSLIAIIIGIFKEMVIYIALYNMLRIPSFGIHATKSWICLIATTILFIGIPFISLYLTIPLIIKVIICILGIIFMFKNSPADTKKKPIVNKKRREIYKFISTSITIVYSIIAILINNQFISNCLIISIIMQNCLISPTVYKIFKLPYNNYIDFLKEHPDFLNN